MGFRKLDSDPSYDLVVVHRRNNCVYSENSHKATSWRFNGKEYDQETGNYYYGARYYDPKLSIWLSVDPMSDQRPSLTPYNFVSNNPIMRIDPTGLLDGWVEGEDGEMTYDPKVHSQQDLVDQGKSGTYKGEEGTGFNPETGSQVYYGADGESFEYSQMIAGADIDGGQMGDHARTMQSPMVQSIHEATGEAAGVIAETAMWIAPIPKIGPAYRLLKSTRLAKVLPQAKWLRGKGGQINGFTISKGKGYGAKPRFDVHPMGRASKARNSMPRWTNGRTLPHYHRGRGNNLRRHRPWEKGWNDKTFFDRF